MGRYLPKSLHAVAMRRNVTRQAPGSTSTSRRAAKIALVAVAASSLAFGVASCSSSSEPPPPPSTSAAPSPTGVPLSFDVTVSPVVTRDSTIGDGDSQMIGVQIMEGRTIINEYSVKARLMYTMDYTDGSGPIAGFLELVWNDGTTIAMRLVDGKGSTDSDGNTTEVEANLEIINGSEKAAGVSGSGTMQGGRSSSSSSSSSLKLNIDLSLIGAPNDITGDQTSESPSASSSESSSESSSPSDSATATSSESQTATIAP